MAGLVVVQAHVVPHLRVTRGGVEGQLLLGLCFTDEGCHQLRLHHRVAEWQAELLVAEHHVGALGIVCGVHATRVGIPPEPLPAQSRSATPWRRRPRTAGRRPRSRAGWRGPGRDGPAHATPAETSLPTHSSAYSSARFPDSCRQAASMSLAASAIRTLGERVVLGLLPGVRGAHALALVFDVRVVGAVGHSHDRGGDGRGMHCAPRHLVDGCGVGLKAGRGPVAHLLERLEAVPGNEDVLDLQRLAAGALQAHTYQSSMIL